MPVEIAAFLQGLGMGASLIMAIGPQNALLLRQGVRRERAWTIAGSFIAFDIGLIALGALGVGAVVSRFEGLRLGLGIAAVAVLVVLAFRHLRDALRPRVSDLGDGAALAPLAAVGLAASVSLLNPAVLFDTIVLIGGIAGQYPTMAGKLPFTLGAMLASALWFTTLAAGAIRLAPVFRRAGALRVLDAVVAVLMLGVAGLVLLRLFG